MTNEFISFYGKNILNESTLINGVKEFLNWCKNKNIFGIITDIEK